ncbi:porin family protein [Salinimicrobium sp. HB62]|uniref:porin family protein n=1 Tax=Salinimicrobium sp. HB62 TaxID=3077781 RepID=UPI002D79259E|nr:porin family protein [Salinimicrobium sp. HB62]
MEKVLVAVITALLFLIFPAKGQEAEVSWGIKGGANASTFRDRLEMDGRNSIDYNLKAGFFFGGLAEVRLSNKLNLQPEILFSHRNTGIEIDGFNINDPNSELDYQAVRTESFLELPVVLRYDMFRIFYSELGLQLGYLLRQKEEVKQSSFGPHSSTFEDYDRVDAGISAGLGFRLSPKFNLTGRYLFGILKRDNSVSSSVIYGGLEYLF